MSDFLTRLAERALHPAGEVRPCVAPLFADRATAGTFVEEAIEVLSGPPGGASTHNVPPNERAAPAARSGATAPRPTSVPPQPVNEVGRSAAARPERDERAAGPLPTATAAARRHHPEEESSQRMEDESRPALIMKTVVHEGTVAAAVPVVAETKPAGDELVSPAAGETPPEPPMVVQEIVGRTHEPRPALPKVLSRPPGMKPSWSDRRPSRRAAQPVEMSRPDEPVIEITIGRVEVRATPPATTPRPAPPTAKAPAMPLHEYLQGRNGGGR